MKTSIPTYIKVIIAVLITLLVIPLIIFFSLQIPVLQNVVSRSITNSLTKALNTTVLVKRVSYSIDNRLVIKGIYVEDYNLDTLFYLDRASFWVWEIFKNKLNFNQIFIKGLKVRIRIDTLGNNNLLYFLENLPKGEPKQKDKKPRPLNFYVKNIRVKDCDILVHKYIDSLTPGKFNPDYFRIKPLNFTIKNFQVLDSTYSFELKDFSFIDDESKFEIKDITGKFLLTSQNFNITGLLILFKNSRIDLPNIQLSYDSLKQLSSIDKINFFVHLDTSTTISTRDIKYFVPQIGKYDLKVKFGTILYGNLGDITIRPFSLWFGRKTHINFKAKIIGLPDRDNLYFDIELDTAQAYMDDLRLLQDTFGHQLIKIPPNLEKLRFVKTQARITGFLKDLSALVKLNTNLGDLQINSDIKIDSSYQVQGIAKAQSIDLRNILNNNKFNKISFQDSFKLAKQDTLIWGENALKLNQLFFNGYTFNNISLNLSFKQHHFFIDFYINDTNLIASLNSEILYNKQQPKINFNFKIPRANLYQIHFDDQDPNTFLSLGMQGQLQGNNPNNITGTITLTQPLVFIKYMEKLQIDKFILTSKTKPVGKQLFHTITVNSDLADVNISGIFNFTDLKSYATNYFATYLPALVQQKSNVFPQKPDFNSQTGLNCTVLLKDLTPATRIFLPALELAPQSKFVLNYMDNNRSLFVDFKSDSILIGKNSLISPDFKINTDTAIKFSFNFKQFQAGVLNFENFKFNAAAAKNKILYTIGWHNNSELKNFGYISGITSLQRNDSLIINSQLLDDSIFINDIFWKFQNFQLSICKSNLNINSLVTSPQKEQKIQVIGRISKTQNDSLLINVNNFDISQLNTVLKKLKINGYLTGTTKITNLHKKPIIVSDNKITHFKVNGVDLQMLHAISDFDTKNNLLTFRLITQKPYSNHTQGTNPEKFVEVNGNYDIGTKNYLVNIYFEKFKLIALYPYFQNFISAISRYASVQGKLTIKGHEKDIKINGDVNITNAAFRLRQTNVVYTVNKKMQIHFTNNKITIDTFTVISQGGTGHGKIWGVISKNKYGDMVYNLHFVPDTLMVLNLPENSSTAYYGTAFISGNAQFSGYGNSLSLRADLRTEENTDLTFKVNTQKTYTLQNKFIHFISHDTSQMINIQQNTQTPKNSNLDLNINLEVNPESKFTIVINEQTGDKLTVKGNGILNLKLTPYGNLLLFGTLTILNGDYFFSLENIITKKFSIQPGSTIKWNGDIKNAQLNLTAAYDLKKVNLYDLTLDDNYWNVRTEVKCLIKITGTLTKPQISFDLELPKADQRIVSQVKNLEEAEKIKQVLSLLILGKFQPLPGLEFNPNQLTNPVYATDMLSTQLSNLLSKLNENLELGVNYQGGQQVNVALSYKLWNERVIIKTDVGIGNENKQSINQKMSPIVGEGEIEVKLNKKGNLRLKIFNQANRNEFFDKGPYTQGVGIFFQKNFSNLFPWPRKKHIKKANAQDTLKQKP